MPSLFHHFIVTTLPLVPKWIVGKVASSYVAGETLDDAVRVVRELNGEGAMATLDVLGEEVRDRAKATAAVDEYLRAIARIREEKLDCNVSVKLTQFGQQLDEAFCRENVERVMEAIAADRNFLRLDMEDRTTTDSTLAIYRDLIAKYHAPPHVPPQASPSPDGSWRGSVGVVFQAYMRRTLRDIAELPSEHANVRLCKGIYIEPRQAAWKGYETVRLNFLQTLEKLFRQGVYVGIATHDEYLVCGAIGLIDRLAIPRERYEFQMLLGVDPQLRRILIDGGHRLRVYVPYGGDWYQYSVRRLRENPEIAGHVIKAMLRGQG